MKFQFSTATILLAIAFTAIACAGLRPAMKALSLDQWVWIPRGFATYAPLWLPITFAAYAIGRKALTARIVLAFIVAEVATIAFLYWEMYW